MTVDANVRPARPDGNGAVAEIWYQGCCDGHLEPSPTPVLEARVVHFELKTSLAAMTPDALKQMCLTFAGTREEFPFGEATSVFKVAGKMFALSTLTSRPLHVSLKCDPELAIALRARYPAITEGYHLNKRHWNTVVLDGSVPGELVREMIEDSYDLVVAGMSKRQQEKLGWAALRQE